MNGKELMERFARAFVCGEIDGMIPHIADNCDYSSDYSGKKYFCAKDIIRNMRRVFSNLNETNRYTCKLVPLDDILKDVTVAEMDNMEGMHPCPWGILLYQFDDTFPAAVVCAMLDPEGKLRSILLSRNTEMFNVTFDDYAEDDDSPLDLPGTVTPLTPKDRHREEMQQASSGKSSKYYIWRKADEYTKTRLKDLGYKVLESKIFADCIGYRCSRKGRAFTVFMYAHGKKETTRLDGDFCSKLAEVPFAAQSEILVLCVHVKRARRGKDYHYEINNRDGSYASPHLWRLEQVNGKYILVFYCGQEMEDAIFLLMYAFNRDRGDVYECIIKPEDPKFYRMNGGGILANEDFFAYLRHLHDKWGNMKLGYVRYIDAVYSALPYLEGYGFFEVAYDMETNRIRALEDYPFEGRVMKVLEFIKADIRESDTLADHVPQLVEAAPLAPIDTERFAVKLYWDNGECRKYVLPIDKEQEKEAEVSFGGHLLTDEIWSSVQVTHDSPGLHGCTGSGTAITFCNAMCIGAMNCYFESTPYSEPQLTDEITYRDAAHCLRKTWTWDVQAIYEDGETGLLRVLLSGHGLNWHGRSTFATIDGKRCTGLEFDYIDGFREGLVGVGIQGLGCGYMDKKMRPVIPFLYEDVRKFYNGRALVKREGKRLVINKTGKEMPLHKDHRKAPYQDAAAFFSDGLCRVSTMKLSYMDLAYHSDHEDIAGCWGFINEAGEEVIPPQYIYANDFEDGFAIVCKGKWTIDPKWDNDHNRGKYWTETELWGGIDRSGNEVIPFIFDEIKFFEATTEVLMAHVGGWEDGKWGVIDRRGAWVAEPIFGDLGYQFADGLITFYGEDAEVGNVGIYDLKAGKALFEPQFLDVCLNENGTIKVEVFDEKLGRTVEKLMDLNGRELFPSEYSSIYTWKDPLEVVIRDENGERHGLVDRSGKVLLPCKFPAAWNGIDWEGKRIIFEDGSKRGLMDFDGNILIPPVYDQIHRPDAPLLIVETRSNNRVRQGLLDRSGKIVIPVEYDNIQWLHGKTHLLCRKAGCCEMYEYLPIEL